MNRTIHFICLLISLFSLTGTLLAASDNNHFLIIANGPYDEDVVHSLIQNRCVIALDGAANNLNNVVPDYILGDFDSITPETYDRYQKLAVKFIYAEDQNDTDLKKGIVFARQHGAKSITICCALGGDRTDHSLCNLNMLREVFDPACPIMLHTKTEVLHFLKDGKLSFEGEIGANCGFFGWPSGVVTTKGLVWDVKNWKTEVGGQVSCSNQVAVSPAEVEVVGDIILICPNNLYNH